MAKFDEDQRWDLICGDAPTIALQRLRLQAMQDELEERGLTNFAADLGEFIASEGNERSPIYMARGFLMQMDTIAKFADFSIRYAIGWKMTRATSDFGRGRAKMTDIPLEEPYLARFAEAWAASEQRVRAVPPGGRPKKELRS